MTIFYESFMILLWTRLALSTIPGLSYMDPIIQRPLDGKLPGEDPCNPLYWYPSTIPEYCYFKPPPITITKNPPLPVPVPVPVPLPVPVPPPLLMPVPQNLPVLPMPLPIIPPPPPIAPPPAIPIALPPLYPQPPIVPTLPSDYSNYLQSNLPVPYPIHQSQAGLVPGLPGLVTKDGGINIMPFSDAYADMLEKHKNKIIRKKLRRILNEYEDFPNSRKYLRLKKIHRMMD